jgi:carbon storage regulator
MLVLTRRAGERVLIGDDIVITILDTRGDGIRIGIEAPRGVNIQRDEIVRAVAEANVAANVAATQTSNGAEERIKAALGLVPAAAAPTAATAATAGAPAGADAPADADAPAAGPSATQ